MSYQVLARKWRPKSFDELVGQQQTATALSNALESQRLHHAYLFTGTRGVGKTTIARILSKSLNCEQGISANPCGQCASCTEIDQGNFVDLMEIDAASKTKVEDTRELLDNVQYRPTRGRYKVYLIDEVHMLSGHSFNALLKTLEEPPPHVVFLLATTDPQKLPVTVLSRCLQFHLRRMEEPQIVAHLSKILTAENLQFEQQALNPIAKGADGSMRDALSLLDQAIAYSGELVSHQAVLEMLGTIDQNFCIRLLQCVQSNDANAVMALIKEMAQFSPDFIEVMSDWLNLLHRLAVIQATNDDSELELSELAEQIAPADLQLYYQLSLQAKKDLAYAPHPRQGFEMALLRVLAFRPRSTDNSMQEQHAVPAKKKLNNLSETNFSRENINTLKVVTDVSPIASNATALNHSNQNSQLLESEVSGQQNHLETQQAIESNSRQDYTQAKPLADHQDKFQKHQENNSQRLSSEKNSASKANLSLVADNSKGATNVELLDNSEPNSSSKTEVATIQKIIEADDNQSAVVAGGLNENQSDSSEDSDLKHTDAKTTKKLSYYERPLYPNEAKIEVEQVCNSNWHIVIDQMKFRGNGQQVLLNSLAEFSNGQLEIRYLKKVEHFLTENLTRSLIKKIRRYFQQLQLPISFEKIATIELSPKDRQVQFHQQALQNAYDDLVANSCVARLQQTIGASVDKSTIVLK